MTALTDRFTQFGEVRFSINGSDDFVLPTWEQAPFGSVKHVPGSNRNVRFLMGLGEPQVSWRVHLDTYEEYRNLLAMRQTEAVLQIPAHLCDLADVEQVSYYDMAYSRIPDVLLWSVSGITLDYVNGWAECDCTFMRSDA